MGYFQVCTSERAANEEANELRVAFEVTLPVNQNLFFTKSVMMTFLKLRNNTRNQLKQACSPPKEFHQAIYGEKLKFSNLKVFLSVVEILNIAGEFHSPDKTTHLGLNVSFSKTWILY